MKEYFLSITKDLFGEARSVTARFVLVSAIIASFLLVVISSRGFGESLLTDARNAVFANDKVFADAIFAIAFVPMPSNTKSREAKYDYVQAEQESESLPRLTPSALSKNDAEIMAQASALPDRHWQIAQAFKVAMDRKTQ